jgi:uncharacterized protein YkwD
MRLRGLVAIAGASMALCVAVPASAGAPPAGAERPAAGDAQLRERYGRGLEIPRACKGARTRMTERNLKQARKALLCLLNDVRRRAKARKLRSSAKLARAALAHSRDMTRRSYFAHTGPNGPTLRQRLRSVGYRPAGAGEIIGMVPNPTPVAIVNAWLGSDLHYRTIVRRSFRYAGIGIVLGAASSSFPSNVPVATATVDFGRTR